MSRHRITLKTGNCDNEPIYSDCDFAFQEYEKQIEIFAKSNPNASDENIHRISDIIVHNKEVQKLGQLEDFEDELGGAIILLRKAFNGFWFKPECLTIFGKDLERFKYKNLDCYDEDLNLYYQTGLIDCVNNVVYPIPVLGATKLDDKVIFFVASGICVVKLEDYGKTWALTKEELE